VTRQARKGVPPVGASNSVAPAGVPGTSGRGWSIDEWIRRPHRKKINMLRKRRYDAVPPGRPLPSRSQHAKGKLTAP